MRNNARYEPCADALKIVEAAVREAYDLGYRKGNEDGRRAMLGAVREKLDNTKPVVTTHFPDYAR